MRFKANTLHVTVADGTLTLEHLVVSFIRPGFMRSESHLENFGALPVSGQMQEEWTQGFGLITTLTSQTSMN